jgi:hypothetical protein
VNNQNKSLCLTPLITDPIGDGPTIGGMYHPGSDFVHVYISNDNTNVYFVLEFAGTADPIGGPFNIALDLDMNSSTGCQMQGVSFAPLAPGNEAVILQYFVSNTRSVHLALAPSPNCSISESSFMVLNDAYLGNYVEFSIGIDTLRRLMPNFRGFTFSAVSFGGQGDTPDIVGPATYFLK